MPGLNRDSPMPLWAQLEAMLRARIAAGEFRRHFPTDAELVEQYDVSRHTVRAAVARLQADRLVARERGRGSTLQMGAVLEQSISPFYSLAAEISRRGLTEHSKVRRHAKTRDARAAARLGLDPDAELVHVQRLRLAGGEPVALDDSWIPADVGAPLLRAHLESGSLYELLEAVAHVYVTGGTERIGAAAPDPEARKLLALARGDAMLLVERVAYAGERPVEYRRSRVHGGKFAFLAKWDRHQAPL
ncbi:MAG: GntR family transcriptional regulator [Gemmatimonadota bacterium]|nr:GntR family transcriptional regulator [Gemmatimonadota bacterium]